MGIFKPHGRHRGCNGKIDITNGAMPRLFWFPSGRGVRVAQGVVSNNIDKIKKLLDFIANPV